MFTFILCAVLVKLLSNKVKMQQTCTVPESQNLMGFCLSDLRLTELISLKKSIDIFNAQENCYDDDLTTATLTPTVAATAAINLSTKSFKELIPAALALHAKARGNEWDSHELWQDEKPSKLQTFFRISITALAFLAFGGYLLCMIVQAIKSKGTTYFYPVVSAATGFASNGVKGIKIYRRGRRAITTND